MSIERMVRGCIFMFMFIIIGRLIYLGIRNHKNIKQEEKLAKKNRKNIMKKAKYIVPIIGVVMIGIGLWSWQKPIKFLEHIDENKISRIEVFNGHTGNSFMIEHKDDIAFILSNIQNAKLERDTMSLGYMGYRYRLEFYNLAGRKIEELIINSEDTIRKDPFFYKDLNRGLCVEYLELIEQISNGGYNNVA